MKRLGFTLAEVLITLAIIGVVAALTIPSLVYKYQKHQFYTAFMKTYNTLSTVLSLAVHEHGNPSTWTCNNSNPSDFFKTYVLPYLSISSTKPIGEIYSSNTNVLDLTGKQFGNITTILSGAPDPYILNDGTVLIITSLFCGEEAAEYIIDTNGGKGPNTIGRDIFIMRYGNVYFDRSKYRIFSGIRDDMVDQCCQTSGVCGKEGEGIPQGASCVEKLLKEGKMDY